ncbi:metal-dependent hydrolase [Halorubrum sp. JWXQ-INN 858]|uniref:metal-dependent hydrolase n=1 Tax=Halorubrum sp. JWXQ-INN 858 TaxID=2690782 RepID=UPI00135A03F4|nr:metal-dependent hydrolase [Halorubrum sp. JWXQ-INN 858]MWV63464.1 metal-dependent hydrolase [Halorubrum sp. JWXQ-INN 858]
MMLPTHALVGLALATPVAVARPSLATPLLAGALAGSVLPDLDVVARHRRTLHYPTGYVVAAVPIAAVAVVATSPATVALAAGTVAAAVHCRMDRYGGSYEFRPWERKSDRAVYDHVRGRWRRAKRWTRYDGAPEDLLVAIAAGLPLLVVLDGPFRQLAAGTLAIAVVYTAFRRRLSDLAGGAFRRMRDGAKRLRVGCQR